jgi:hypothetical protein
LARKLDVSATIREAAGAEKGQKRSLSTLNSDVDKSLQQAGHVLTPRERAEVNRIYMSSPGLRKVFRLADQFYLQSKVFGAMQPGLKEEMQLVIPQVLRDYIAKFDAEIGRVKP